jgi:hypothetical protein
MPYICSLLLMDFVHKCQLSLQVQRVTTNMKSQLAEKTHEVLTGIVIALTSS